MIDAIPLPSREGAFEQGFWAALDEGHLAHQRCADCQRWHFPPRWRCVCGGELAYRQVSGRATLWSWTVVHAPVLPAFAPFTPYVVGIAELEETPGLRMVGPLIVAEGDPIYRVKPDLLKVGMPLVARIDRIAADVAWPSWKIV